MTWPFDYDFSAAPGGGTVDVFNTLTWTHNAGLEALDLAADNSQGVLRFNETPQTSFTLEAEIELLTSDSASTNGNWVGLWALTGEVAGHALTNRMDDSSINHWTGFSYNPSTGVVPLLGNVSQVGYPEFTVGVTMTHKMEYSVQQLGGKYVCRMIYTVNGVRLFEVVDGVGAAGPAVPGVFLYGGTARLHRLSGVAGANAADFVLDNKMLDGSGASEITPGYAGELATLVEGRAATKKIYYANGAHDVTGRVLGPAFQGQRRRLLAMRVDTGEWIGDTVTNTDGTYTFTNMPVGVALSLVTQQADGTWQQAPRVEYVGTGRLAGICRVQGVAVAGAIVKVFSEDTNEYLGSVLTNGAGEFEVPNVLVGGDFYLVFRESSLGWEDRVSSRRVAVS